MAHVKTINGKKYYYQSIRKGKKVTSKYLGPVNSKKRKARDEKATAQQTQQDLVLPDDSYIG